MLLCFACLGLARAEEVMIGNAESTTTQYTLPVNMYYHYSLTQQIYTAEEIGMAGTINSIAFEYTHTASFNMNGVKVYMMNVDKETFETTTDMVSLADAELVWEGTFAATEAGWVTLDLDTPFAYDGQSNLLVCCYDPTSGYPGSSFKFRTTATTDYLALAYYSDSYTPSLTDVSTFSGSKLRYQYRANIMLDITPGSGPTCDKPETLEVSNVTAYEAELTWTGGSGTYNVEYKAASDEEWEVLGENVTYTTYNFTTLDPATTYNFHVQSVCENGLSGWKTISFTTECAAITSFPWTENFDSYTAGTGFLPICWERINTGTSYNSYPYVSSSNSHSTSNCLYFYSYGSSSTTTISDQYAILPVMENLAGKQINLFAKGTNAQSTFTIGTITDPTNATTFTAFATQALTTTYQEFIYFVPANTTDNYLAIMMERPNGTSSVTRGVYIDDITINFPPACPKPTALTVTDVTAHAAQLSWTSDADAWQIMVNNDTINAFDVTTNPYVLEDLADGESYTVTVRANCDIDGYSEWSNNATFTTPIACPAPTGLAATDITGHTAQLNWTGNSDSYIVHYRNKTTAEEGLFQGFNTSGVPTGWATYSGLLGGVLADTIELASSSSYWLFGSAYNGVFDAHTRINIYGTSVRNWLVSPSVEVAANYVFDFDLALTKYSGTLLPVVDTLQQDDKFVVLISTDNMETWTILRQWDNAGSEYVYNNITCSATGEHVSFDLSAYVGQNVRIAFYGESTVSATGSDNNLHIDNVVVGIPIPAGEWMTATTDTTTYTLTGLIPTTEYEVYVESVCEGETSHVTNHITITTDVACPAPTALTVANITPTSVDLSWTSSADAWEIEVADDQEPPVITNWDANAIPFTVPGLFPETDYTIRVRANCGDEGYSEWSTPITFTTLEGCPVPFDVEVDTVTYNSATVAWTGYSDSYILNWGYGEIHTLLNVDFEDQTIPADWTNTAPADTLVWKVVTDTIHNSYYMMSGNAGVHSSTSEVSCAMTYPADGFIEFDAQCMGEGTSWDVCRFLIDGSIVLAKGANGSQWDHYSFAVTAGEHTFTWRYSKDGSVNPTGDHFAVDNIKMYWEEVIWQEPITTDETEYTFTGLIPETDYFVTVTGVCGDEQTEASEMVEFTTLEQTTVMQTVALASGKNWFSTYVEITLSDLQAALVATGNTSITIASQFSQITYANGRWRGSLSTFDVEQMYRITVGTACEIELEGMPVNPAENPVVIPANGAKWIGFPFGTGMTVTEAFAGFAVNGDKISSQSNGSATYTNGRWRGQLTDLVPGQGYNYKSAAGEERTFTFPSAK